MISPDQVSYIITALASALGVGGLGVWVIQTFIQETKKANRAVDLHEQRISAIEDKLQHHDDVAEAIIRMDERMKILINKIDVLENWLMSAVSLREGYKNGH